MIQKCLGVFVRQLLRFQFFFFGRLQNLLPIFIRAGNAKNLFPQKFLVSLNYISNDKFQRMSQVWKPVHIRNCRGNVKFICHQPILADLT